MLTFWPRTSQSSRDETFLSGSKYFHGLIATLFPWSFRGMNKRDITISKEAVDGGRRRRSVKFWRDSRWRAGMISFDLFLLNMLFIHTLVVENGNLTEYRLVAFILSFHSLWSSWISHPNRITDESIDGFLGRWLENLRLGMILASMLKVWGWSDGIRTNGFPSISFLSLWSSADLPSQSTLRMKELMDWIRMIGEFPAWYDAGMIEVQNKMKLGYTWVLHFRFCLSYPRLEPFSLLTEGLEDDSQHISLEMYDSILSIQISSAGPNEMIPWASEAVVRAPFHDILIRRSRRQFTFQLQWSAERYHGSIKSFFVLNAERMDWWLVDGNRDGNIR